MNNRTAIMIALLAVVMMTASIASAGVDVFNVTSDDYVAGNTSNYTVQLNTTGFNSLNVTIPAGYEAVVPEEAGQLVARVDMWGIEEGEYANATFTANSTLSTKVDVSAQVRGDDPPMYNHTKMVDYSAGSQTTMSLGDYTMTLTLPAAGVNGSLNFSTDADVVIANMTIVICSVKNPATGGDYDFVAKADGETVGQTATVNVTTGVVTINILLTPGWNMVSFPVNPTDPSVGSVFANVSSVVDYGRNVYTYGTAGYEAVNTVEPKVGYWVFSVGTSTITVEGTPITTATIILPPGWNMIGIPLNPTDPSVGSVFANVSSVVDYGRNVYTYGTAGYEAVNTVEPKVGYWVFSVGTSMMTVEGTPVTS